MPTYSKVWVKTQAFKHLLTLGLGSKAVITYNIQLSVSWYKLWDNFVDSIDTDSLMLLPINSNIFDYVDHKEPKSRIF